MNEKILYKLKEIGANLIQTVAGYFFIASKALTKELNFIEIIITSYVIGSLLSLGVAAILIWLIKDLRASKNFPIGVWYAGAVITISYSLIFASSK